MAKLKEITLKMVIDNEGNVAKIAQVGDAMERAGQQARNMNREVRNTSNALGNQTKATNLAGQTALEFSRIASDSAYGIRGMANNIGQVATMMGELSKAAPKGISAMDRLKFMGQELGAAIMGPYGIIIAIQGLLSWLTLWESSTNNQTEAQKKLNEELDITATKGEKTSQHIETLIAAMGQTGVVSTQAKKDLAELIPNYEKLRETMSLDEVAKSYKSYLFFQEQALGADQDLADNRAEIMVLETKMLKARATGNTALGEDTAKKIKQLEEDREILQEISDTFTAPYLKLKELFREEEQSAKGGYVAEFYGKPADEILLEAKQFNDALIALQTDAVTEWEEKEKARIKEFYSGLMAESMKGTTISEEQIAQLQADELAALDIVEQQAIDKREMLWQDHLDWMAEKDAEFVKRQRETDEKALKLMMEDFNNRIEKQQFFTSAIGAIMANSIEFIGGLAEKNTKNEERLFKIQKQVAIATTIIDTIVAAQRAYTSQLNPLDPTSIVKAKIAAAVAITAGMARVAAIRAQKLPSKTTDSVSAEGTMPVTTTGFSNLSGGETPGSAVRVYVLEHDIRTTTDKVSKTKVRSRL